MKDRVGRDCCKVGIVGAEEDEPPVLGCDPEIFWNCCS